MEIETIEIVRLVNVHGVEKARSMVETAHQRRLVDIAHDVMADEKGAIGISYSGMCLTGLPYRKLEVTQTWLKRGHRVTLLIEPGHLIVRGQPVLYGVPWGSRGRILLMHLMTQAIRTKSREVVLGKSARDALKRMGLGWGGEASKALWDQASRLAACTLRFSWEHGGGDSNARGAIIDRSFTLHDEDERQTSMFQDTVMLNAEFFNALQAHPVPLSEEAIRQLSYSPMALDVYTWLAYRLHTIDTRTDISWTSLCGQFGTGYKAIRQFRNDYLKALSAAVAAYPDARVELTNNGLRLLASPPPVNKAVSVVVGTSPTRRRKAVG